MTKQKSNLILRRYCLPDSLDDTECSNMPTCYYANKSAQHALVKRLSESLVCTNFFTTEINILTHYYPVLPFYAPCKHQKTIGFLIFSGGIKRQHRVVIG